MFVCFCVYTRAHAASNQTLMWVPNFLCSSIELYEFFYDLANRLKNMQKAIAQSDDRLMGKSALGDLFKHVSCEWIAFERAFSFGGWIDEVKCMF